jgi:hypothetical protein
MSHLHRVGRLRCPCAVFPAGNVSACGARPVLWNKSTSGRGSELPSHRQPPAARQPFNSTHHVLLTTSSGPLGQPSGHDCAAGISARTSLLHACVPRARGPNEVLQPTRCKQGVHDRPEVAHYGAWCSFLRPGHPPPPPDPLAIDPTTNPLRACCFMILAEGLRAYDSCKFVGYLVWSPSYSG